MILKIYKVLSSQKNHQPHHFIKFTKENFKLLKMVQEKSKFYYLNKNYS